MHIDHWERECRASQRWADRARRDSEVRRRDRWWFAALAVIVVLGVACATLIVIGEWIR